MHLFNKKLSNSFSLNKVIKVIAGLNNNDIKSIIKLAKALELTDATYIDIIANTRLVSILNSITDIPICVSSIDPLELYNCILCGADIVEIGNFDIFYSRNIVLSDTDVLNLAIETRKMIPNNDICVTIPHYLDLYKQVKLAKNLEQVGINIIQTEGYSTKFYNKNIFFQNSDNVSLSTSIASASLSATYAISQSLNIPVITSSGINCLSSPMTLLYGASGIGLGTALNNQTNIFNICVYINEISHAISNQSNHLINNSSISSFYQKDFMNIDNSLFVV
uniref:Uncharacterized protein ycf23 n=1 Tax=Sphondylothamnion multifidum TaxID=193186 RepID=A0A4D6X1I2_9FLOR|nr:hypothetical protein [Sphondylothamnion multifidum]